LKKPFPTKIEGAATFGRGGLELSLLVLASLRWREELDAEEERVGEA
jgi:hypothetical protein